jgi:hypothetical protein
MWRFIRLCATPTLLVACGDVSPDAQEKGETASIWTEPTSTPTSTSGTTSTPTHTTTTTSVETGTTNLTTSTSVSSTEPPRADVVGVRAEGEDGFLTVFVSILSEETGCDQYADWWELVAPDGTLVYRRILNHSHPDEQPFERSGVGVDWTMDEPLYARAHMVPWGYVGHVMWGSMRDGFETVEVAADFAADLETQPPLPEECWW